MQVGVAQSPHCLHTFCDMNGCVLQELNDKGLVACRKFASAVGMAAAINNPSGSASHVPVRYVCVLTCVRVCAHACACACACKEEREREIMFRHVHISGL